MNPSLNPARFVVFFGGLLVGVSSVNSFGVIVNQTLTDIVVSPPSVNLLDGQSEQFTAIAYDQFGMAFSNPPTFTWDVDAGGDGFINSNGLYDAPLTGSTIDTIRASDGGISGTASVAVTAVPEPVSLALVPVASLALLRRRKQSR